MKTKLIAAAILSFAATAASAAVPTIVSSPTCATGNLGVTATCIGFFNTADIATSTFEEILGIDATKFDVDVAGTDSSLDKSGGSGNYKINFEPTLAGTTMISVNYTGNVTAFYTFNGTGVDEFTAKTISIGSGRNTINFVPSSATLYSSTAIAVSPVPEPAPVALMGIGLGLLGFVARRRNQAVKFDNK